jgi:hypothetical protein
VGEGQRVLVEHLVNAVGAEFSALGNHASIGRWFSEAERKEPRQCGKVLY